MSAMTPTLSRPGRSDDFDMAKLQKTLKQRQRHAIRNSANVAKLTPAEIRELNIAGVVSTTGSQSSTKSKSSRSRSRQSTNATPPVTPDSKPAYQTQKHRTSVSSTNGNKIPTPPHTPNGHRKSTSSARSHQQHHHHVSHAAGVIHAPRPRGNAQAAFISANGLSSRPSSSASSSSAYRGLPTYRGPEMTRSGSVTMLQYPSQQIVANPLSYFSRPRQSQIASHSPERSHRESGSSHDTQSSVEKEGPSLVEVSAPSSRQPSPPGRTDSPVSEMHETDLQTVAKASEDLHNQPKVQSDEERPPEEVLPGVVSSTPQEQPAALVSAAQPGTMPAAKQEKHKRFTLQAALFGGGDKTKSNEKKLKKERRKTMTGAGEGELNKESSLSESNQDSKQAVDVASVEEGAIPAHPAVRPLSILTPDDDASENAVQVNGMARDTHTDTPMYGRCSCCGRIKRPRGFDNALSPVVENENLRTNFSFEVDRTTTSSKRRSSDASRDKFTPIIPMIVGPNESRQASIEPYTAPTPDRSSMVTPDSQHADMEIASSSPVKQQLRSSNASPIRTNRLSLPPRFTRFASLHGRRNGDNDAIVEEDEEAEAATDERVARTDDHPGSANGVSTQDFAMSGAVPAEQEPTRRQVSFSPELEYASKSTDNGTRMSSPGAGSVAPVRVPVPDTSTPSPRVSFENSPPTTYHDIVTNTDTNDKPPTFVSQSPITRVTETPTSATNTTPTPTIFSPTSTTSTQSSSLWEQELVASFSPPHKNSRLSPNVSNGTGALRPKFSFESVSTVLDATPAQVNESKSDGDGSGDVRANTKVKVTGKRMSMMGGLMGVKA